MGGLVAKIKVVTGLGKKAMAEPNMEKYRKGFRERWKSPN